MLFVFYPNIWCLTKFQPTRNGVFLPFFTIFRSLKIKNWKTHLWFNAIPLNRNPFFVCSQVKCFAERLKHVMFFANMVLVTATIVPYVYGLSIEPSTGRCVNFSGEPRWVSFCSDLYSCVPGEAEWNASSLMKAWLRLTSIIQVKALTINWELTG